MPLAIGAGGIAPRLVNCDVGRTVEDHTACAERIMVQYEHDRSKKSSYRQVRAQRSINVQPKISWQHCNNSKWLSAIIKLRRKSRNEERTLKDGRWKATTNVVVATSRHPAAAKP